MIIVVAVKFTTKRLATIRIDKKDAEIIERKNSIDDPTLIISIVNLLMKSLLLLFIKNSKGWFI